MAKKIVVLATHGIGEPKPDFADQLVGDLTHRLRDIVGDIHFAPVFWSDVLDPRQDKLAKRMRDVVRARWNGVRNFVIENLSDASAYVFMGDDNKRKASTAYYQINLKFYAAMKKLVDEGTADDDTVVVGITHSMGGHVLSNYVWDIRSGRPDRVSPDGVSLTSFEKFETLGGLFMAGCNMPILLMGYDESEQVPIVFPGPRYALGRDGALWQTFFDKDDVLGYPVAPLYQAYFANQVPDYPPDPQVERPITDTVVSVGNILTGWNPYSHVEYWADSFVLDTIAAFVRNVHSRL